MIEFRRKWKLCWTITDFFVLTTDRLASPGGSLYSQIFLLHPHHWLIGKRKCSETWSLSNGEFKKQSLKLLEPTAPCNCAPQRHSLWRQPHRRTGQHSCYNGTGAPLELIQEARLAGFKLTGDWGLEAKRYVVLFQHALWIGFTVLLQHSPTSPFRDHPEGLCGPLPGFLHTFV